MQAVGFEEILPRPPSLVANGPTKVREGGKKGNFAFFICFPMIRRSLLDYEFLILMQAVRFEEILLCPHYMDPTKAT
jgi:hypothetical protein